MKLPSLIKLRNLGTLLEKEYKGTNEQRLFFISLYKLLVLFRRPQIQKILSGALIFEMEIIEKSYSFSSPLKSNKSNENNKSKGWFATIADSITNSMPDSGSKLYTLIVSALDITNSSQLSDGERLIYLWKFYNFISEQFSEEMYKRLKFPEIIGPNAKQFKENFLKLVRSQIKRIKKRESARISLLAHGTPRLIALQKNIVQLFGEYEEANSSRWFTNEKRKSMILFLNLVNDTCITYYNDASNHELQNDINYIHSCNIRLGALLFALLKVSREYKLLSPKRSHLFRQVLHAMNIESLQDIKCDKKITWLRALVNHLHFLKENNRIPEKYQGDKNFPFDYYLEKANDELAKQEIKKITPSTTKTCITYTASVVAQYGMGLALTELTEWASSAALIPLNTLLVGSVSGPLGMVVYGIGGTIIMTQLGRLVTNHFLPNGAASLYGFVLEKIGGAIGRNITTVTTYTFTVGRNSLRELLNHKDLKQEDKDYLEEWIDTLLELPNDMVPEEEKNQIRNVLGIEKPQLNL